MTPRTLVLVLALWPLAATAANLTAPARIIDGDTLELSDGQRIRLWGIDAVEGSQFCRRDGQPWRCGDDAASALRRPIQGQRLTCDVRDHDRYERIVAVCRIEGWDIGAELVRQGWALDYYSSGPTLPSKRRL